MSAVLDPPSAVAASICWLARWRGMGRGYAAPAHARHPKPCGWCDYRPADLLAMVVAFNDADELYDDRGQRIFDRDGQPAHRIAGAFHRLPNREQRALVDAALYPIDHTVTTERHAAEASR